MIIKEIEVKYTPKGAGNDPLRMSGTISLKIATSKGVHGECVELPENVGVEDVITAVNLLLARVKHLL